MSIFLLVLLMAFNFAVSWWNARVAGQIWQETKALGGWLRAVAWAAAVQSACGFTSVFAIILLAGVHLVVPHTVTLHGLEAGVDLMYVMIILPLLGSGMIITMESWIRAYRERDFASMGIAGYNTFAMTYDTINAASNMGSAFSAIGDFFSDDDEKPDGKLLIILLVLLALAAGIFLTHHIMVKAMGTLKVPAGPPGARMPPAPRHQAA